MNEVQFKKAQKVLCSTVYVINDEGKHLMMHHKKLGKWTPPGGKVEPDETPDEAAVREVLEETGLNVQLIGEKTPVDDGMTMPFGTQLNVVIPGEREHFDLIYLAKPIGSGELTVAEREAHDIGWFSLDEVKQLDTFPSVIQFCEKIGTEVMLPALP